MKYINVVGCLLLSFTISFGQSKTDIQSTISKIAKAAFALQIQLDRLSSVQEWTNSDTLSVDMAKLEMVMRPVTVYPIADRDIGIELITLDHNILHLGIIGGHDILREHPRYYFIGFNAKGQFYFLYGFWKSDLEEVVKATMGAITTKEQAQTLADLYFSFETFRSGSKVVDKDHILQHPNSREELFTPRIVETPSGFKVEFMTVHQDDSNKQEYMIRTYLVSSSGGVTREK